MAEKQNNLEINSKIDTNSPESPSIKARCSPLLLKTLISKIQEISDALLFNPLNIALRFISLLGI